MATFYIRYALAGGFGGVENADWEKIDCNNLEEAESTAYQAACDEYDNYEGLHGLRTVEQIMEEDELSEEEAEEEWREEREGWLDYEATATKPEDFEEDEPSRDRDNG